MNKRFLLAITLCVSFFWVWQFIGLKAGFFKPPAPKPSISEQIHSTDPESNLGVSGEVSESSETNSQPEAQVFEQQTVIEREVVILENERIKLVFDNQGAVISQGIFKHYFETSKKLKQIQVVPDGIHQPAELIFESGLTTRNWMFEIEQSDKNRVVFKGQKDGVSLEKIFTLDDKYGLTVAIETNHSESFYVVVAEGLQPVKLGEQLQPSMLSFGAINPKYSQVSWSQEGNTKKKDPNDLDAKAFKPLLKEEKVVNWLGITDNYFANVFKGDVAAKNVFVKSGTSISKPNAKKKIFQDVVAVEASGNLKGLFYIGPLREATVDQYQGFENVISFGWAGLLSKGLFVLLRWCHNILGNWGWSIIVLTLFIKLVLMPLTLPGIKSSYKMKKLQPKIQKLKQKYPSDDLESKQKMNQEMFALYKEEGVNPFGSCVTGIIQMPVFFAYFSLLRSAFELRQADWIFWVTDLSAKDPTFILVLIMGATMYFSMQAMQMSVDPMQQKMMKFMPVVFTFFFIGMPSGLILYMITSNLYTMVQTYFFKRRYEANA